MSEITLTIDGKVCKGVSGQTVLEVAQDNDVYIPTLCHQKGLSAIGACRMCVVEVEGSNKLLTSCTTPATDGMVVHTKSEKLFNYRKEILELLFAGRNHFCMFCSDSGDCELQKLAIEHGIDSIRYPYIYSDFSNDTSNGNIQIDHNRCILCLRCVRVCAEKVGVHTLDLEKRGWDANIISDLGLPLGDSETCVNCGACAQVCPTGAITIRDFVYRGRRKDCDDVVESVCPLCSMGCKIDTYVRTGSVARVEGADLEGPDGGQLCHKGRWGLPKSTEQERLSVPMIREGSAFREASWTEALSLIASKFHKASEKGNAGAVVSGMSTNEELSLFSSLFRDKLGMKYVDVFDADSLRGYTEGFEPFRKQKVRPFTAASNILKSDLVLTLMADPQEEAPVTASYIRVVTIRNSARLVNFSSEKTPFPGITDVDVRAEKGEIFEAVDGLGRLLSVLRNSGRKATSEEIAELSAKLDLEGEKVEELIDLMITAEHPVIVLGQMAAEDHRMVTAAANLAIAVGAFFDDGLGIVPMLPSGNSLGAVNTMVGMESWLGKADLDFLYVYSTGMAPEGTQVLDTMSTSRFTVAQTPYMVHPLVNLADVLLPAPSWAEHSGHFCTLEGETRKLNVIVEPADGLKGLYDVLGDLAGKMGVTLDRAEVSPCRDIFASEVSPEKAQMVKF